MKMAGEGADEPDQCKLEFSEPTNILCFNFSPQQELNFSRVFPWKLGAIASFTHARTRTVILLFHQHELILELSSTPAIVMHEYPM